MRDFRFLSAISILAVGCSDGSSLGSDRSAITNAGAGGGSSAGVGGTALTAGTGQSAQAGSKASGSGGSSAGTATAGAGSGGAMQGGSGSSAGASGTPSDAGRSSNGGSAGSTTGGSAGMEMGQGGEAPINVDAPKTEVEDPDATGEGPCATKTAREVLAAIGAGYPDFADIDAFYDPMRFGQSAIAYPFTSEAGFSLVLARGAGDCLAGCINWEYWYFQTDASCTPQQVGHYSANYGPGNCYTVVGEPMWGVPANTPTSLCTE